jgi:hypothetical protein
MSHCHLYKKWSMAGPNRCAASKSFRTGCFHTGTCASRGIDGRVVGVMGRMGVMGVLKEQGDANALTAHKMMEGKMINDTSLCPSAEVTCAGWMDQGMGGWELWEEWERWGECGQSGVGGRCGRRRHG